MTNTTDGPVLMCKSIIHFFFDITFVFFEFTQGVVFDLLNFVSLSRKLSI